MNSLNTRRRKNSFWTPARVMLSLAAFGLVAAIGASSCNSNQAGEVAKTSVTAPVNTGVTNALPASVREAQLTSLEGTPFKLSDYAGKVVLINLWATWCGPCRVETPHLVQINKDYKARGLQLVGLTTENPATAAELVKSFVQQQKIDYQIGYASGEVAATLMQDRNAIPQSFLVSRDGRVLKRFIGFDPFQTPVKLREAVEQALNDKG